MNKSNLTILGKPLTVVIKEFNTSVVMLITIVCACLGYLLIGEWGEALELFSRSGDGGVGQLVGSLLVGCVLFYLLGCGLLSRDLLGFSSVGVLVAGVISLGLILGLYAITIVFGVSGLLIGVLLVVLLVLLLKWFFESGGATSVKRQPINPVDADSEGLVASLIVEALEDFKQSGRAQQFDRFVFSQEKVVHSLEYDARIQRERLDYCLSVSRRVQARAEAIGMVVDLDIQEVVYERLFGNRPVDDDGGDLFGVFEKRGLR